MVQLRQRADAAATTAAYSDNCTSQKNPSRRGNRRRTWPSSCSTLFLPSRPSFNEATSPPKDTPINARGHVAEHSEKIIAQLDTSGGETRVIACVDGVSGRRVASMACGGHPQENIARPRHRRRRARHRSRARQVEGKQGTEPHSHRQSTSQEKNSTRPSTARARGPAGSFCRGQCLATKGYM